MDEIRIHRLIWNDWNIAHIARHDVKSEEVEQVCHGDFIASQTYKGRIRITGPTSTGRILAIILSPKTTGDTTVLPPTTQTRAKPKDITN